MAELPALDGFPALGARFKLRLIRTLDIGGALVLDAVVLVIGFVIIYLTDRLGGDHSNSFFTAARMISHGFFVVAYLVLVAGDLIESLRR